MRQRRRIKRSELHRMVWEEPMRKLAPTLGMSDVGLRKVCVRNNIPVPPRGHWAKAAMGRVIKPAKLPKPNEDWDLEFEMPAAMTEDGTRLLDETFGPMLEAEALPENHIEVTTPLVPHAMTRAIGKRLKAARDDPYGAVLCEIPEAFRVRVPSTSIDRALALVDALVKAAEKRGFSIQPHDRPGYAGQARIQVGEVTIGLSLEESLSRRVHRATEAEKAHVRKYGYSNAPTYDFVPSGLMTLKLEGVPHEGFQITWKDTANRRLETRLNEVMVGIIRAAHAATERRKKEQARKVRVDAENARRAELRAERDAELELLEELEADAAAWRRAEALRAYIAAAEAGAAGVLSAGEAERLERGRRLADRLDPLTPSPKSPLDYTDAELRPLYEWQLPLD